MDKSNFEELKKVFNKYVIKSNIAVVEDILEKECDDNSCELFLSECGKFLTDSFTFLKKMNEVPQMYRERLFNSFYGTRKTDITKKWFIKTFKNDNTNNKRLTSHILCLIRGFINEQKRTYELDNIKNIKFKMTTEDKADAYDEAIENASKLIKLMKKHNYTPTVKDIVDIFTRTEKF